MPFCLLFGFAFAQDAGDGPTVSAMGTVTANEYIAITDANYVTTVEIGGKTYALVTGYADEGVQIMGHQWLGQGDLFPQSNPQEQHNCHAVCKAIKNRLSIKDPFP